MAQTAFKLAKYNLSRAKELAEAETDVVSGMRKRRRVGGERPRPDMRPSLAEDDIRRDAIRSARQDARTERLQHGDLDQFQVEAQIRDKLRQRQNDPGVKEFMRQYSTAMTKYITANRTREESETLQLRLTLGGQKQQQEAETLRLRLTL